MTKDVGLDAAAQENERLLQMYRLPDPSTVRQNTFEIAILAKYAAGPASMGDQFALAHLDRQAQAWYGRALAINPNADGIRQAMAKLTGRTSP
jgi:hypothetical protein